MAEPQEKSFEPVISDRIDPWLVVNIGEYVLEVSLFILTMLATGSEVALSKVCGRITQFMNSGTGVLLKARRPDLYSQLLSILGCFTRCDEPGVPGAARRFLERNPKAKILVDVLASPHIVSVCHDTATDILGDQRPMTGVILEAMVEHRLVRKVPGVDTAGALYDIAIGDAL